MMTTIEFYKYQGTGNDFVMIDNRDLTFPKQKDIIHHLCDRRFGIGADGLILLENSEKEDFKMVYYNADGNESTMCGNGGRCLVAFAHFLDLFEEKCHFMAVDGAHEAMMNYGIVRLKMKDVELIENHQDTFVLDTGSPHLVKFVEQLESYQVYENGKKMRNSEAFHKEGINVNFVERIDEQNIFVRTYERGVEDETYSCGTGVTASALVVMSQNQQKKIQVKVLGGALSVSAEKMENGFTNIWLEGPAKQVFKGKITL